LLLTKRNKKEDGGEKVVEGEGKEGTMHLVKKQADKDVDAL